MTKPTKWVCVYPLSAQQRLWSDWADVQADLSLRWAHNQFVGFVKRWPVLQHSCCTCFNCYKAASVFRSLLCLAWRRMELWTLDTCSVRFIFTIPYLFPSVLSFLMHLSMFSPQRGWGWRDYAMELDNFEKLGSNSLPMWHNFGSKIPGMGLQRTRVDKTSNLVSDFQKIWNSLLPEIFTHIIKK